MANYLDEILARKRSEVRRRLRHGSQWTTDAALVGQQRGALAEQALRRGPGAPLRVIAEIKRRSPSAGTIRPWARGDVQAIAQRYEAAGATAISVLCDRVGFGGSALDLRRASQVVQAPLLFKEFVLDPVQVRLAARVNASMVLLLVRALEQTALEELVVCCQEAGLAPVVEAADAPELERALQTRAKIVGVNSRDLRSFHVDTGAAGDLLSAIPPERIAVFMSGVRSPETFAQVASGRADAVLIGEYLMAAQDTRATLQGLLSSRS